MNDLIIREERPDEYRRMENIIRDAFWDKYSPGCCEHLLVNRLRSHPAMKHELCFAAEYKGELAGGIWYAEAMLKTADSTIPVLTMGPVGIRPDLQGIGIGGELIRHTLTLASNMSYPAVVIYGNPAYYGRFGFKTASDYGVTDAEGNSCSAMLLYPFGTVPQGAFDEGNAYAVSADDARKFDRQFVHRQRHIRSSQLFFVPPSPKPEDPVLAKSWEIRRRASELLRKSGIVEAWEKLGAKIRLVGSCRSDLMCDRDIDLHVYTEKLDPAETLRAFTVIFSGKNMLSYTYINSADTDESCLEWHLRIKDETGEIWTVDMIQILAGAKFDGLIEDTTEAIMDVLTPETRKTILLLKNAAPAGNMICGIEFYCAVIEYGIRTWDEFVRWRPDHPLSGLMFWHPKV